MWQLAAMRITRVYKKNKNKNILLHTLFSFHPVNKVSHLLNSGLIVITYSPPDNTPRPTWITGIHPVCSLSRCPEA